MYQERKGRTQFRKRRRQDRMLSLAVLLLAVVILILALMFITGVRESMQPRSSQTRQEAWQQGDIPEAQLYRTDLTASEKKYSETNSEVSGEKEWNLVLVNSRYPIRENYSVELTQLRGGHAIDSRAYPDLQDMMDDARSEGLAPLICSSYRSYEKQVELYQNQVGKYLAEGYSRTMAEEEAAKWVAIPGTSEHHTGLAVDIVANSYQLLDEGQERTPEQQWLMENSWKYGFVLRYPNNKSEITGIYYEPWHYRYVGKEAARKMYQQDLCLEEYLSDDISR